MNIHAALLRATAVLREAGVGNCTQEARWLLEFVTGAHPPFRLESDPQLPADRIRHLDALLNRRTQGEPLQYVLGSTEFYGLRLEVGPGVLIPRPETERLVDVALELQHGSAPVIDVCTGSGAIALALARFAPAGTPILGLDLSPEALAYARRNAASLGLTRVEFRESDLFAAVGRSPRVGMITANPPYVSPDDYDTLPREVRCWEPKLALWAPDRGLGVFRRIAREARGFLVDGGWLLCEISPEQSIPAARMLQDFGYGRIVIRQDYTGRDRVAVARWQV